MENSKNSPPVKKLTFEEEVNQVEIKNREKFYFENVFKDLCALEKEPSSDENSKEKKYLREKGLHSDECYADADFSVHKYRCAW